MIDLHIHSTHSDGTDSVIEILKKAEELKLEIISITDHDTANAHIELQNIRVRDYYSGKIIIGAEFKSIYKKIPVEVLGYGFDIDKVSAITNPKKEKREKEHLQFMKDTGKLINLKFDDKIEVDENHVFASDLFGQEIFKYDENIEIIKKYNLGTKWKEFYRNAQTNPKSIFYIDETAKLPPLEKIIDTIHNAGGFAFLAHPFEYPFENKLETIEMFINEYNIDGLECFYSKFSDEQIKSLVKLCKKYKLLMSGGSDYHGNNSKGIFIGVGQNNLNITKEALGNWIEKCIL